MAYLLHQLLTRSAERDPNKTAVVDKQRSTTYGELERASNQLADTLLRLGIVRGDRVGFCLNKSIESIISIFGILKAGAVYVPLDPAAPPKRLAFIAGNCGMKVLIGTEKKTSAILESLAESSVKPRVLLTDHASWQEMLALQRPAPMSPVIEQDLAYILYTSGSTGEPKGVMISHRTSLTFVDWAQTTFVVGSEDRVSSHAPLHFDLSIFDIFASIKGGATIVLVPDELSVFAMDLARFIEEQSISIWYSVPSALTRMVLHGDLGRYTFSSLRTVLFAGEVFPTKYLRELRARIPRAQYYNLYGPTETNVCTFYHVKELQADSDQSVPIGKACANIEVFAVNDQGEIADPGEEGELHVRGSCIANGYWAAPEKTQQQMIHYPLHAPFEDAVVYRTGDIVTQNESGDYLFVGRRDHMIKSRGYRIELGDIEAALYAHPKVVEVAAIAVPNDEIGNIIKAVVVARVAGDLSKSELELHCSQRIPKYMIPSEFEFREGLPKTSTGKVDKKLLIAQHSKLIAAV